MEGVRLNLSRFIMILHNIEIIDHTIDKMLKGDQDLDTKIHIGASYYFSKISNIYVERMEVFTFKLYVIQPEKTDS